MLGTADPQQDTAEPMSQAGGTSGNLWWHYIPIFRNGQSAAQQCEGKRAGTKVRGEQRFPGSLWNRPCWSREPRCSLGRTHTGAGKSVRKEWQTDQMLPIPTLWATGSREEGEELAKE